MKMTLARPLMTNSKMTLLFLHGALSLPLSKRALARWLSVREVRLWTGVCPPSLVTSLRNRANFLFHQPCLFIGFWAGSTRIHFHSQVLAPTWGRALAIAGSQGGVSPTPSCRRDAPLGRLWGAAAHGSRALGGRLGHVPSSCWNHLCPGSSQLLPCSAQAANVRFSLLEWKDASGLAEELQDLSPPACTRLTSLLNTKCYLGIFANWFWYVSAIEACMCWEVFVWDSISSGGLRTVLSLVCVGLWLFCLWGGGVCVCTCKCVRAYDSSVFGVCVYSIWVIGILVAFCKVANSGAIH